MAVEKIAVLYICISLVLTYLSDSRKSGWIKNFHSKKAKAAEVYNFVALVLVVLLTFCFSEMIGTSEKISEIRLITQSSSD